MERGGGVERGRVERGRVERGRVERGRVSEGFEGELSEGKERTQHAFGRVQALPSACGTKAPSDAEERFGWVCREEAFYR